MTKVTLDPINNTYGSTTKINANSITVANELNNKVLYRDNPDGEANQMENSLDMNNNRIHNLPDALTNQEPVTYSQLLAAGDTGLAFVPNNTTQTFGTVALAKASSFTLGDVVATAGHTTAGDGGGATYLVETLGVPDGYGDHATDDGDFQLTLQTGERPTLAKYGSTGNGTTDDTSAVEAALTTGAKVAATGVNKVDPLVRTNASHLIGDGTLETASISNTVLSFRDDGTNPILNPIVDGLTFDQPHDPLMSGGTNNNHHCLKFYAANNARARNLVFNDLDLCLGVEYGSVTLSDRACYFCHIENIKGEDVYGMGVQIFGSKYGTFKNIRMQGTDGAGGRAMFSGVRLTAFNFAANEANIIDATVNRFTQGVTIQSNSHNNIINAIISDCTNGVEVHGAAESKAFLDASKGNQITAIIRDCTYGLYDGSTGNIFNVSIDGSTNTGIYLQDDGGIAGLSKGNTYRGVVRDTVGRSADIRGDFNTFGLTLLGKNTTDTTFGFLVSGSNNSGNLSITDSAVGLSITGDNNVFNANVTTCTTAVSIAGDNNTVVLNTDGNVTLSGNNNTISGYVGGTITNTGTGNNWSEVSGHKYTKRFFSQSTDASGYLTLTHNLGISNVPFVTVVGIGLVTTIQASTDNSVSIRLYDTSGVVQTSSTGLTIDLIVEARING